MRRARLLALSGLTLAAVVLVAQTGAFSSAAADRDVGVSIVDDQSAYLGIETEPVVVPDNETTTATLATVTNRFSTAVDVSVTVSEGAASPPEVEVQAQPGTLQSGGSGSLVAAVTCGDGTATETVALDVDATGENVAGELSRSVRVTCEAVTETETIGSTATATEDSSETATG